MNRDVSLKSNVSDFSRGRISTELYAPIFIVVCPFSVLLADGPDVFVSTGAHRGSWFRIPPSAVPQAT